MGKSQLVRARDVARLIRAVHEIDEVTGPPVAKMEYVADLARRLLGAKLGAIGFGEGFCTDQRPKFSFAVGAGCVEPHEQAVFAQYVQGDISVDPCIPLMAARPQKAFACRRRELVSNTAWFAVPHVAEDRRRAGVDDVIYSMRRYPRGGALQSLAVHRPWGDKHAFTERDRVLLQLLHQAMGPKVSVCRPLAECERLAQALSPRVREALGRLLRGASEKEVADQMTISTHTLHGYVKDIYRHFGVRSRLELHAKWNGSTIEGLVPAAPIGGDGSSIRRNAPSHHGFPA